MDLNALGIRRSEIVGTLVLLVSFLCPLLFPISQVLRPRRRTRLLSSFRIGEASEASTPVALQL